MLKETLFELFGELNTVHDLDECGYGNYTTDDFIICVNEYRGRYHVTVDLKEVFNKTSQSPIHFKVNPDKKLSKRKKNRIREATRFLLSHRKIAGTFFGCMDGFDDLGYAVQTQFYR